VLVPKLLTTLSRTMGSSSSPMSGPASSWASWRFFFGAAEKFKETITDIRRAPKVLVIRMRNVPAIDSTGLNALRDVVLRFRGAGTRVILSDVHAQPMVALQRSALGDELPEGDLVGNIDDALNAARVHLGLAPVSAPAFAVPTVAREDRRRHPRPPG
jgi:SulP family sulfate permease